MRIGRRVISLRHMIICEDAPASNGDQPIPPGGARVTLEQGVAFDLDRPEADLLRRHIDQVVHPDPAMPCAAIGMPHDPVTGEPLGLPPAPDTVPPSKGQRRR